jgi:hypothetical protein
MEAPHVRLLRKSEGGPYYLAPDSTEPLPSGMWANLNPAAVENEAMRIDKLLDNQEWQMGVISPQLRASYLADGELGEEVISVIEGRAKRPEPPKGP